MTGTDHPSTTPGMGPAVPRCGHSTNNGNGIVWHCALPPHPESDGHYMVADELAERRRG